MILENHPLEENKTLQAIRDAARSKAEQLALKPGLREQIELDEEDEKILDEIWDGIHKEDLDKAKKG